MNNCAMVESTIEEVKQALRGPRHSISDAYDRCPDTPGVYAVYGTEPAWIQLGLQPTETDGPLYVGKAEDSLVRRDLRTHFTTGRTGSSTLRRSIAALLRDELALKAIPRNTARPDHFANFAVESDGDARLTLWMQEWLTIAFWEKRSALDLDDVETMVLATWFPPLNISKIRKADSRLRLARKAMADEARRWSS